ncbi:MAG TPA: nitrogenase component 1 [Negativicutes bacterium]|nr:nitrogenase component 1 [Negativicutes bacterium]
MMGNFVERPRFTCALGGAITTVSALPRTIHIIHAPPGCAGNLAWTQAGGCGLQVGGYCGGMSMPGTNVQEREVVFGGADRLSEQVDNTLKVMDGDLYFVLTSCVTEIIGDDVRSVVGPLANEGIAIIYAETAGFKGNSYQGYDLVIESLFRNYVIKNKRKTKKQVNLWGVPPGFDAFWRGNLLELRRLLQRLGLSVNTFFTGEDNLEAIRKAGSAGLNIVVSEVFGGQAAATATEIHGIPSLISPLPIGPSASAEFLRRVGAACSIDERLTEQVITEETMRYYQFLEPLTDCFNDMDLQRYAAVVGDANYAVGITRFLADDLGWLPEVTAVTDVLNEVQEQKIVASLSSLESKLYPKIIFSPDTSVIRQEINAHWQEKSQSIGRYSNPPNPAFVVGSSFERELAKDLGAPHLSVSFPVSNRAVLDRGYTGYTGGLRLIEDLIGTIIAGR